ncbi:MAG: ClbS/DfsB family four-helix bundle protein [Anaerolineales bacterium]|nr:ClbS/DfsB family four-helix bundle protein [Anaerolineales bacterium]
MDSSPRVQQLIDTIQGNWATWEAIVAQIDEERLTQSGVAGDWTLKDIIAHITWHEKEMVGLITAHALVGSELWNLPTDERNAAMYEEVRNEPLEQVLEESAGIHQQLLELLPTLSDEDLTDPSSFPNMPPDWQPWMLIAQNTYEHYQDHIQDIERWLAE